MEMDSPPSSPDPRADRAGGSSWMSEVLAGDTLSKQEEQEIKSAFSLFDSNQNGQMENSELLLALKCLGFHVELAEVDRLVTEMEPKVEGSLTVDEFRELCIKAKCCANDSKAEVREAFELFVEEDDPEGNFLVSVSKITDRAAEMGEKISRGEARRMIAEAEQASIETFTMGDLLHIIKKTSVYENPNW